MLTSEEVKRLAVIRESHPDAFVYLAVDGLFIVTGTEVRVLVEQFSIDSSSPWLAFDSAQAAIYIDELMKRGHKVVLARDGVAREVAPKPDRRDQHRPAGTHLAIDPLLLFERCDLNFAVRDEALFEDFKRWLRESRVRELEEFGRLYVFVFDRWYEVEPALTTMLPHHAKLLAKAALETGTKLPCRLVEPRPRRGHSHSRTHASKLILAEQTPLGQLRFDGL